MSETVENLRQATRGTEYDGKLYLVGGFPRDRALGLPVSEDVDLVLEGDALKLARFLFEKGLSDHAPVLYPRFGTAMIAINGHNVELVGARAESYDPANRKPSVKKATLKDDAFRRDFTINTLMENLHTGEVLDLTGKAIEDLKAGIIRTPLEPRETFYDDPLRMLRAVRFSARFGFTIELETWKAIQDEAFRLNLMGPEPPVVSAERIRDEFLKMVMLAAALTPQPPLPRTGEGEGSVSHSVPRTGEGEGLGVGAERWTPKNPRGASPIVQETARILRKDMTQAERILWQALRGKQVDGVKFRRQHPVGRFVLDFYASSHHLAIELDGGIHDGQELQDAARTEMLRQYGYRVLRFRNDEVLEDLAGVLARIREALADTHRSALTPRPPLPRTGEGESEHRGIARDLAARTGEPSIATSPPPFLGVGAIGPVAALELLRHSNLLAQFFPELLEMVGVSQNDWHLYDVWEHTMVAVSQLKPDAPLELRLGLLLHDVGKPRTRTEDEKGVHFYEHQFVGADMAHKALTRLKLTNDQIKDVTNIVALHMRLGEARPEWSDAAIKRLIRATAEYVDILFELSRCDHAAMRQDVDATDLDALRARMDELNRLLNVVAIESPLDGNEIMEVLGVPPGPILKEAKEFLVNEVIEGRIGDGDKEAARAAARTWFVERQYC